MKGFALPAKPEYRLADCLGKRASTCQTYITWVLKHAWPERFGTLEVFWLDNWLLKECVLFFSLSRMQVAWNFVQHSEAAWHSKNVTQSDAFPKPSHKRFWTCQWYAIQQGRQIVRPLAFAIVVAAMLMAAWYFRGCLVNDEGGIGTAKSHYRNQMRWHPGGMQCWSLTKNQEVTVNDLSRSVSWVLATWLPEKWKRAKRGMNLNFKGVLNAAMWR